MVDKSSARIGKSAKTPLPNVNKEEGKFIVARYLQPSKVLPYKVVTPSGIVIDLILVDLKAEFAISVTPSGRLTVSIAVFAKAELPILFNETGHVIRFSLSHDSNAWFPISSIVSGSLTLRNESQIKHNLEGIDFIADADKSKERIGSSLKISPDNSANFDFDKSTFSNCTHPKNGDSA